MDSRLRGNDEAFYITDITLEYQHNLGLKLIKGISIWREF